MLRAGDLTSGLSLLPQALRAGLVDSGSRLIFLLHWPAPSVRVLQSLHLASDPILLSNVSKISRPKTHNSSYFAIDTISTS